MLSCWCLRLGNWWQLTRVIDEFLSFVSWRRFLETGQARGEEIFELVDVVMLILFGYVQVDIFAKFIIVSLPRLLRWPRTAERIVSLVLHWPLVVVGILISDALVSEWVHTTTAHILVTTHLVLHCRIHPSGELVLLWWLLIHV